MSSSSVSEMSTASSVGAGNRNIKKITAVKTSIDGLGWRQEHRAQLSSLVNSTTEHACSLAKYIFLRELQLSVYPRKETGVRGRTGEYRTLIDVYLPGYLEITGYERRPLAFAQQSALYESEKMYVAYTNNVRMRFGQHLRRAVNALLQMRQRKVELEGTLTGQRLPREEITRCIREEITLPATQFKQAIARRGVTVDDIPTDPAVSREAFDALRPVLEAYGPDYVFREGNIYYDCKVRPFSAASHSAVYGRHVISRLMTRSFGRTSWVETGTIDRDDASPWEGVINLQSRALPVQGPLRFHGTIVTDGVGVTVFKKLRAGKVHATTAATNDEPLKYIVEESAAGIPDSPGGAVIWLPCGSVAAVVPAFRLVSHNPLAPTCPFRCFWRWYPCFCLYHPISDIPP